jgi:hypothetical protein
LPIEVQSDTFRASDDTCISCQRRSLQDGIARASVSEANLPPPPTDSVEVNHDPSDYRFYRTHDFENKGGHDPASNHLNLISISKLAYRLDRELN